MALSHGISCVALPIAGGGSMSLSVYSSSSSQVWPERKVFASLRLASSLRPNSRGGISRQLQQTAAVDERDSLFQGSSSAESARDEGEISKEDSGDRVEVDYRGAAPSRLASSHGKNNKFSRAFPGQKHGDAVVTVPAEALKKGAVFKGIISSIQDFGAFVNFGAFAEGLLHISKLSTGYVKDVNDVVHLGQEVMVSIVNVEQATGRIALSLVEKGDVDLRKPYVPARREEGRNSGDGPGLHSGSSRRLSLPRVENKEKVLRGSHPSSVRSMEYRQRKERSRYRPGSGGISDALPEEHEKVLRILQTSSKEMEKIRSGEKASKPFVSSGIRLIMAKKNEKDLDTVSSTPNISSGTQGDARRQMDARRAGEGARFLPGSGGRSPFGLSEEEKNADNPSASTLLEKVGEEVRTSRNEFASPRQRETREEDRNLTNPFAESRQWEAGQKEGVVSRNSFVSSKQNGAVEEVRMSRNSSAESRNGLAREEGRSPASQQEEDLGQFLRRMRAARSGGGAEGEEKGTKPRMNLVQIRNDENVEHKMEDNRVSSSMRSGMRSLFECDCC